MNVPALALALALALAGSLGACGVRALDQARDASFARRIAAGPARVADHEADCNGGRADACRAAGTIHAAGIGVPIDGAKALGFFRKACEGDARACEPAQELADLLGDTEDDLRACARERDVVRCADAGSALLAGWGVPRAPARAAELLRIACRPGEVTTERATVCDTFGFDELTGSRGVPIDEQHGVALLDAACARTSNFAPPRDPCAYRAIVDELGLAGHPVDMIRARDAYMRACPEPRSPRRPMATRDNSGENISFPFACYRLGLMRATGHGLARDDRASAQLLARACLGRDRFTSAQACAPAAAAFLHNGYRLDLRRNYDPQGSIAVGGAGVARELAQLGCFAASPLACRTLAAAQAALDAAAL